MSALLQIKGLSRSYQGPDGTIAAVDEVSLTVDAGEFVAVQGPSGCGKTTLLLVAGALLQPTRGQVLLKDQDLYALSSDQRARFRAVNVGFVFQQFHLMPYLNVLDNILASTLALGTADGARATRPGVGGTVRADGPASACARRTQHRRTAARGACPRLAE